MKNQRPKSASTNSNGSESARDLERASDDVDFRSLDLGCSAAPDMTRRIMGRLGYMRVTPAVARRHRIRRWIGRGGVMLSAALALAIGIRLYESSADVRRPHTITIPAAIGNDIERHQHHIGNVINTIRRFSIPAVDDQMRAEPDVPASPPDDADDAALAAYRWV